MSKPMTLITARGEAHRRWSQPPVARGNQRRMAIASLARKNVTHRYQVGFMILGGSPEQVTGGRTWKGTSWEEAFGLAAADGNGLERVAEGAPTIFTGDTITDSNIRLHLSGLLDQLSKAVREEKRARGRSARTRYSERVNELQRYIDMCRRVIDEHAARARCAIMINALNRGESYEGVG